MDALTVLTTADNRRLAKVVTRDAGGYHVEGYEAGSRFEWEAWPIEELADIEEALGRLSADAGSCVIRGAPRHPERRGTVNRCQHAQEDGRQPDWDHARPGRRWVAFDIDKLAIGGRPDDMESAAIMARATLPEPFRSSACVYKLSSSAGLDGWQTVSMHLWFVLDRPVYDLSWRRWAEGKPVDPALFKAVQPHYTADPVFVGCEDPLAGQRLGHLPPTLGDRWRVPVPDELMDYDGWLAAHKAELRARQDELAAAQARIVAGFGQSPSATRRYAVQALAGGVGDLLQAPVGGRHAELVTKAFKLGGYVQDGFLGEAELLTALEQAIAAVFPAKRQKEELRTAREMVRAGMAQPLDLSHIGRGKAKLALVKGETDAGGETMPTEGNAARETKKASADVEWVDLGEKGAILHTAANLAALMDWMGYQPRRNLMSHESDWTNAPRDIARECLQGAMASVILDEAQRHGWSLPEAAFWRCLGAVEARRSFHPVEDWVRDTPWDGVSRFDELFDSLTVKVGFEEYEDLMRVQLHKWLVAGGHCLALGRNAAEGVAVQGVLVLQGRQDLGKTRWFRSLVPDPAWIAEGVTLDPSNTDSVIAATSAFLVELGELDATTKKSDVAQLKSFLTRSVDKYRAAYGRKAESYPRRTLFGATVNPDEFLVDQTGNRRFWVMPLEAVNASHGVDMQQVWAEALARAEAGEAYWMPEEHKEAQLRLAAAYQTRSEWADDFWHTFRLPDEDDAGTRYRASEVREMVWPERRWSQSEMRSFGLFLRSTGAKTDTARNVVHIRLVRR